MFRFTIVLAATVSTAAASGQTHLAGREYRLALLEPGEFRLRTPALDSAARAPVETPDDRRAARPFAEIVARYAREAGLDPALVHAVIEVESRYDPRARSPKGALGLMQVMPGTAARYGIRNPGRSVEDNLRAGTLYLRDLMAQFGRDLELVLAAYNAGEGAVIRHGQRVPPYRETRQYVPAVLERYRGWREPAPVAEPPVTVGVEYLPGTRLAPGAAVAARGVR